ncbi:MAG: hypothetical protein ACI9MR_004931, partial [Myxococcota bacterium]
MVPKPVETEMIPNESIEPAGANDAVGESPLPEHYRAVEVLGRGRARVTYLASDARTGGHVVVKAILQSPDVHLPSSVRQSLSRRSRTLTLLDHPHISTTYGLEQSPHGLFLVRELAPGKPLNDWAGEGVSVDAALTVMRDLASALAATHELGAIHGWLTSQNVIVQQSPHGPEVRIVDLGLSEIRRDERRHQTPLVDPFNQAPWLRHIDETNDPRADLYALGTLTFQMLTGRLPYRETAEGGPRVEAIGRPLSLRSLRADVPVIVAAIVDRLLNPALTECYQAATSVLADLERYQQRRDAEGPDVVFALGEFDSTRVLGLTPPFVGRALELHRIGGAIEEARQGTGQVVLVQGESGLGKSRFIQEAMKHAEASGAMVLRGFCTETEVTRAFQPWRAAIASYVSQWENDPPEDQALKANRLREAVGSLGSEIHTILPALAPLVPADDETVALDSSRQGHRHVDLVSRVVQELARIEGFLIIVLDD